MQTTQYFTAYAPYMVKRGGIIVLHRRRLGRFSRFKTIQAIQRLV